MIDVEKVTKRYGKIEALNDVSMRFERGRCIALIGPNGSGKSTLMKCILGLVHFQSGDILFKGTSIRGKADYRNSIGYMPQYCRYPEQLRVEQMMSMMKDVRGIQEVDEELIEVFGVERFFDKKMNGLSGGMRQKVNASLSFYFKPEVLFLDEPTAGLDPVSVEVFKDKVRKELSNGRLIVITSHVISDLEDLISEVVYMQEGKMLFHLQREELIAKTNTTQLGKGLAQYLQML